MASPAAVEFLTKQITVKKEIVTFRWLSRALSVHVNVAKNELASFHASRQTTDEPVHATFLLTGEIAPVKATGSYRDEDAMDVEVEQSETVSTTRLVLVGEDDLESAKMQFTRLSSVHIYSLSPSAIRDAALLAPSVDRIRPDDLSKGRAYNQQVGIVVSSDVKVGRAIGTIAAKTINSTTLATSSKSKPPAKDVEKKIAEKPKSADNDKEPDKVKTEDKKKKGTLDWSKAKTKVGKEKEAIAAKKEKEATKKESKAKLKVKREDSKANIKKEPGENETINAETETKKPIVGAKKVVASEKPKRGAKRPSAVMSLSDSEEGDEDSNPAPKTKPRTSASPLPSIPGFKTNNGVRARKGVLISDDEDEETQEITSKPKRLKGKGRAMVSDEEDDNRSVGAMMDLDDSEVTRHDHAPAVSDHQSDDADIEMLSDSEPVLPRPKQKRKPKKVVPVGSNGLPKKRVVKSRKSKNARGFMVTEDYSSYESVSESEQVPAPSNNEKKSQKGKKKKPKKEDDAISVSASENASSSKARPKPRASNKSTGDGEDSSMEQARELESETNKPGSGSGGGSKSSGGAKGGIMNYFVKK